MQCQNNLVVVALTGIFVGVMLGAGTSQYAQLVAYNSNSTDQAKIMENPRERPSVYRWRSTIGSYIGRFRTLNADDAVMRSAAPDRVDVDPCRNAQGERRIECIGFYRK